jgi:hypothetical protein
MNNIVACLYKVSIVCNSSDCRPAIPDNCNNVFLVVAWDVESAITQVHNFVVSRIEPGLYVKVISVQFISEVNVPIVVPRQSAGGV